MKFNSKRISDIEETISALDHVIGFYNVSTEVESIIRAGPAGPDGLENFLSALDKLKQAQNYFEKNNPQSVELENVVSTSCNFHENVSNSRFLNNSLKKCVKKKALKFEKYVGLLLGQLCYTQCS